MEKNLRRILSITLLLFINNTYTPIKATDIPLYICTASDSKYFNCLLQLIGCLHNTNFDHLGELCVVDLGMSQEQKNFLGTIEKVAIHQIQSKNPEILRQVITTPWGKMVPGWYAWKPVAIKEVLEKYPYILWLDAGTTVLRPLDDLCKHIVQNDYLLINIGEEGHHLKVGWGTTNYVRNKLNVQTPENSWILNQVSLMASIIGATKKAPFLQPLYDLTNDIKCFEDDGSAPGGFGQGRQDQTLLSILSYAMGLHTIPQNPLQESPSWLTVDGKPAPLYITWIKEKINQNTQIYSSRIDYSNYAKLISYIRYKK